MTEPEKPATTTATTTSTTKTRGTGFPVISLPAATKIIREAGTYGKVHTANALASYAGHTTANSGAWRAKAAALRDWGLVVSAPTDSFALTDRALQIAHPTSPEAAQKAMLEAFNNCKLYVEIFNDMAKGTDLKITQIANTAVTGHGVAVKSKDAFATSFVESAAAVGLAKKVSADVVQLLSNPADVGAADLREEASALEEEATEADREVLLKKRRPSTPPVVNQTWPIENGEITLTISSSKPFEGKVFVEIGTVIGAIEKLAQLAGVPAEEDEE
jgi:hypothetical protein